MSSGTGAPNAALDLLQQQQLLQAIQQQEQAQQQQLQAQNAAFLNAALLQQANTAAFQVRSLFMINPPVPLK